MRIFKNRGDIYFSKVNKKKSIEQKILLIALIAIVIFTILFVTVISIVNDFSVKKFFAPDDYDVTQTSTLDTDDVVELPNVEGKSNFATMVYEDDTLLFTILTQVDMDNTSYKVSVLKGSVVLDGSSLEQVLISSGEANALNAIESAIGTEFDYYISMESSDFEEFFDELGEVNFPVLNEIKYKEKESPVTYSLKLKAGEQKIDGKYFVNLIRYYLDVENNSSQANELVLASLSQQLNSENMEDSESLFKDFISVATTNITVRDFSLATDELTVLTSDEKGMNVYNAQAEFDGNEISEDSLKTVKGYFVK